MIIKGAVTNFFFAVVFFITGILFIAPAVAFAHENAVISHIKLANTRDDLLAYFKVEKD